MKKIVVAAVLLLAVPSLALAAKPPAPGNSQNSHGKAAPKVMYVLKGMLTAYTAANGTTNGSVTISVKAANRHGAALKNTSLTLAVSSATKIATENGAAVTVNDKGIVKVRAPKNAPAGQDLGGMLASLTAFQVIDQGASS